MKTTHPTAVGFFWKVDDPVLPMHWKSMVPSVIKIRSEPGLDLILTLTVQKSVLTWEMSDLLS